MLNPTQSRIRQQRLLAAIKDQKLDAVVIGITHHVYYFTAFWPFWLHHTAVAILADGRSLAVTANQPAGNIAADEVRAYPANANCTLRQDHPAEIAKVLADWLRGKKVARIGFDASAVASQLQVTLPGQYVPIDPVIWQLRRQKDEDELVLIRRAHLAADAMFERAAQVIRPGVEETHMFAELHAAALKSTGEPMTALLGNDYACGVAGGPPRGGKKAEAGQIYIIDVGPTYRGYFSDGCRNYVVGGEPTDAQQKAHDAVKSCIAMLEKIARPGVSCRQIATQINEHLKSINGVGLVHHLGHGVGLQPHEFPHLNDFWDDVLLENEVFTCEPGAYNKEINGGVRLENVYLVKKDGLENLIKFPAELM